MLLSAVIISCIIIVNAEQPLNNTYYQSLVSYLRYSLTGDNNGYDYSNIVTNNGYFGSKDNYQNSGSFYNAEDTSHKLSNYISSHSLVNAGNQDSIGSDIGNSYNGYSANDHGNEYTGYSNTYDNSDSNSYTSPTRITSTPFKGYSNLNNNGDSTFNAYSSDSIQKDFDFGHYATSSSSSKKIPIYSPNHYFKPSVLENYPEGSASDVQGYDGSSASSSYSEIDHAYASYPQGGLTSEYLFGKQKNGLYNLKSGNKYSDIYSIPSGMRYTRGNTAHLNHNHDVPLYVSSSGPSSHSSKIRGSGTFSSGKPSKYGHKYFSRYAPNSGVTYMSRERDGYSVPYGKSSGKIIVIKDSRPSYSSHMYSDELLYAGSNGGYRNKNGGFTSSNFDGYSGNGRSYDNPTSFKRYMVNGPMLLQKTMYP